MAKKQNEIALYDAELAAMAEATAAKEATKGKWFSTQAGQLSFNDTPVPGNKMGVIIIDHMLENAFYPGKFQPGAIVPPDCFALARDEGDLKPHELSLDPQHDKCDGCPQNQWGSADTGKGKACGNRRRLALLPAGVYDKNDEFDPILEPEHYKTAEPGFLKLPSTSLKGWAQFVKQLAATLKRPPLGVIAQISVIPDTETQFKVLFEPIMPVPNTLLGVILERHKAMVASNETGFPYDPNSGEQAAPAKGKKGAVRQTAKKAAPAAPAAAPVKVKASAKKAAPATPAAAAPKVKAGKAASF